MALSPPTSHLFKPMPLMVPFAKPLAKKVVFEAQMTISGVDVNVTMHQQAYDLSVLAHDLDRGEEFTTTYELTEETVNSLSDDEKLATYQAIAQQLKFKTAGGKKAKRKLAIEGISKLNRDNIVETNIEADVLPKSAIQLRNIRKSGDTPLDDELLLSSSSKRKTSRPAGHHRKDEKILSSAPLVSNGRALVVSLCVPKAAILTNSYDKKGRRKGNQGIELNSSNHHSLTPIYAASAAGLIPPPGPLLSGATASSNNGIGPYHKMCRVIVSDRINHTEVDFRFPLCALKYLAKFQRKLEKSQLNSSTNKHQQRIVHNTPASMSQGSPTPGSDSPLPLSSNSLGVLHTSGNNGGNGNGNNNSSSVNNMRGIGSNGLAPLGSISSNKSNASPDRSSFNSTGSGGNSSGGGNGKGAILSPRVHNDQLPSLVTSSKLTNPGLDLNHPISNNNASSSSVENSLTSPPHSTLVPLSHHGSSLSALHSNDTSSITTTTAPTLGTVRPASRSSGSRSMKPSPNNHLVSLNTSSSSSNNNNSSSSNSSSVMNGGVEGYQDDWNGWGEYGLKYIVSRLNLTNDVNNEKIQEEEGSSTKKKNTLDSNSGINKNKNKIDDVLRVSPNSELEKSIVNGVRKAGQKLWKITANTNNGGDVSGSGTTNKMSKLLKLLNYEAPPLDYFNLMSTHGETTTQNNNNKLMTCLGRACILNQYLVAESLLKAGADPNIRVMLSPSQASITNDTTDVNNDIKEEEDKDKINVLYDKYGSEGSTPLMLCAGKGYSEMIWLLVEHGAWLGAQDIHQFSSWDHAKAGKHLECANLVEHLYLETLELAKREGISRKPGFSHILPTFSSTSPISVNGSTSVENENSNLINEKDGEIGDKISPEQYQWALSIGEELQAMNDIDRDNAWLKITDNDKIIYDKVMQGRRLLLARQLNDMNSNEQEDYWKSQEEMIGKNSPKLAPTQHNADGNDEEEGEGGVFNEKDNSANGLLAELRLDCEALVGNMRIGGKGKQIPTKDGNDENDERISLDQMGLGQMGGGGVSPRGGNVSDSDDELESSSSSNQSSSTLMNLNGCVEGLDILFQGHHGGGDGNINGMSGMIVLGDVIALDNDDQMFGSISRATCSGNNTPPNDLNENGGGSGAGTLDFAGLNAAFEIAANEVAKTSDDEEDITETQ